jgi:AraC-like DNA-binding protein
MPEADRDLRDLCARIFRNPGMLLQVTRLRVGDGFRLTPHAHNSILQFDVAVGCSGGWIVNGRKVAAQAVSAIVFYPRQQHGYELTAKRPDAEIYGFKLRVAAHWPIVRKRLFPTFVANVSGEEPLLQAFRRLARLNTLRSLAAPLGAVALSEVLCLWPRSTQSRARIVEQGAAQDERLERALELIESRLAQPPALKELASAAHLSPRHFARRFRALYGCSAHDFVTARRIERSGELLTRASYSVTEIAESLGFPSIHTFSRWFRHETGATPTEYRQKPASL